MAVGGPNGTSLTRSCAGSRVCVSNLPLGAKATATTGASVKPPSEKTHELPLLRLLAEMSDTDEPKRPTEGATAPPLEGPSVWGNSKVGWGALRSRPPACATATQA